MLQPVYNQIRRFLPSTGALDLAPLVALLVLIALRNIIIPNTLRSLAGY
jgi:YggT family protein